MHLTNTRSQRWSHRLGGGGFTKINVSSRYQNKKNQSFSERFCALFWRMSFLYLQAKLGEICQRTNSRLMLNLILHIWKPHFDLRGEIRVDD